MLRKWGKLQRTTTKDNITTSLTPRRNIIDDTIRMKVYQKDKLPTDINVAKDEISTTEVECYPPPRYCWRSDSKIEPNLISTEVKAC